MGISLSFIRLFFLFLCVLLMTAYTTHNLEGGLNTANLLIGILGGISFTLLLAGLESFFKQLNLRSFNVAILGLFVGYLMGQAITLVFDAAIDVNELVVSSNGFALVHTLTYLLCAYLGLMMTARASEEFYISLPFVKFKPISHKKKDILLEASALTDSRIIDLASTGLLNHHLLLPRFILKDLYSLAENPDESIKSKARRCLEVVKKLESLPNLDLRYVDTDFPDVKDPMAKLIRLARFMDANIMTSDINRIQQASHEGVCIINIHMLSNALKPITQTGEFINIKIQRYGKEPRQGVGYLEDGTMVVVNGGAEYIGETIKAQVLSVKHTTSGRMIFCNTSEENLLADQEMAHNGADEDHQQPHKSFFSV